MTEFGTLTELEINFKESCTCLCYQYKTDISQILQEMLRYLLREQLSQMLICLIIISNETSCLQNVYRLNCFRIMPNNSKTAKQLQKKLFNQTIQLTNL